MYHVMLAAGVDGGEEQLPLNVSPIEYDVFSRFTIGSPSSSSRNKYKIKDDFRFQVNNRNVTLANKLF